MLAWCNLAEILESIAARGWPSGYYGWCRLAETLHRLLRDCGCSRDRRVCPHYVEVQGDVQHVRHVGEVLRTLRSRHLDGGGAGSTTVHSKGQ